MPQCTYHVIKVNFIVISVSLSCVKKVEGHILQQTQHSKRVSLGMKMTTMTICLLCKIKRRIGSPNISKEILRKNVFKWILITRKH